MKSQTHTRLQRSSSRPVSRPHDPDERQAERAADVVGRGGSVAEWSFSSVSPEVQRQEVVKEKTDEEKKKEALDKTKEAVLETPQAKALKDKVLADPLVKTVKDAVTSTPGIIATGAAAAGGVAALGATGKALPFQPPEIPLDKITPGLSAKVKYEGPVNAPTFVGLTLTYKEQGPKGKKTPESDKIAADIARLKAQQEMFKPQSQKTAEKQQEDELVQAWIKAQSGLPGLTIPLKGTAPKPEDAAKKEEEKTPVQPAPASPSSELPAHADVDDALSTSGRALDARARRSMETRFGYDFSGVRVHDDARASATAGSIDAAAFTVGTDVVFASGRYDPASAEGQRLLAHELAHVVQQQRAAGSVATVQRKNGGAAAPATTLGTLSEDERKQIQIVTAKVTVPGLAEKFATTGTTVKIPLAAGATAAFDASVDASLQHGLTNVAGALSNGVDLAPAPLPRNSTVTLELDVGGTFGKGLYRFTHHAPTAAPGATAPAPAPRIIVEVLGKATAPAGTKAPPPAKEGETPASDPVAEKIKKHSFSNTYSGTELDALRAALDQIPDAQLAVVAGLKFRRDTAKATDPTAAGDYDPKTHTVTMYDKAFASSQTRYKGAGSVASDSATRAIVHEIGHAIDLSAMRKAGVDKDKADAAVAKLPERFPDPKDPKAFRYENPEQKKEIDAVLKAQKDAEAAVLSARSLSGSKTVKKPGTEDFEDVIGTDVKGIKFREAAAKDGGKAVSVYGDKDVQEAFAEAYSLYITSPDTLKALRPNVFDYLAKNLPK
jgi:hypothetical protein